MLTCWLLGFLTLILPALAACAPFSADDGEWKVEDRTQVESEDIVLTFWSGFDLSQTAYKVTIERDGDEEELWSLVADESVDLESLELVGETSVSIALDSGYFCEIEFDPETLEPETLEPETLEPETLEPETLEPETLEPVGECETGFRD